MKKEKIMGLYEDLTEGKEKLSLVGLGYVGMPIAVAFARKIKVVGFDLNSEKIELYKSGVDPTKEVGDEVIASTSVEFTADEPGTIPYSCWMGMIRSTIEVLE